MLERLGTLGLLLGYRIDLCLHLVLEILLNEHCLFLLLFHALGYDFHEFGKLLLGLLWVGAETSQAVYLVV